MHYSSTILALIGAVGVSARQCRDITIPISISSRNNVLDLKPLTTEIEVTNFYLNLAKQGSNYGAQLTTGVSLSTLESSSNFFPSIIDS
jgi:hypothetical protein